MQVNKQQLEPDMEQWAGSKVGNVYIKAVYYHTAYLTFMQSISCEMLCWMKHRYNPSSVFFILSNSFSIYNSLFFFFFCFFINQLKFSLFSVLFPNSFTFLNTNALYYLAFLVAKLVKNLPAMQKTQIQSLGQEGSLEN